MTEKIFAILLMIVICFSMAVSVSAYTDQYVYDPDSKLSQDETEMLDSRGEKIEAFSGYSVIFCIVSDNEDMSADEYAEEAYYTFTDSEDAFVFVHNVSDEEYGWCVSGDENNIFSEDTVEYLKTVYDTAESYYDGIREFYEEAEDILAEVSSEMFNMGYNPAEDEIIYTPGYVSAERDLPLVVDYADILSEKEETELLMRCESVLSEYQMELAILTVDDLEGKTARDYADDFYDYNGYGYGENDDGMLVLYKIGSEGDRELHITTHGKGSSVFYDSIREDIYSDMKAFLLADDCYGAFDIYLDKAEAQLKPGVPVKLLLIFMAVGAVVGIIITTALASRNRSVVAQANAKVYTRQGSMNITGATEKFLYTHTDVRPKPQNNGGSVSSTHRSSSGRSHGGTGGRF